VSITEKERDKWVKNIGNVEKSKSESEGKDVWGDEHRQTHLL